MAREPDIGMRHMKVGEEVELDTSIDHTYLTVRRVRSGWLYTYTRMVMIRCDPVNEIMTTTFVPE